jgi:hypothetical protein
MHIDEQHEEPVAKLQILLPVASSFKDYSNWGNRSSGMRLVLDISADFDGLAQQLTIEHACNPVQPT